MVKNNGPQTATGVTARDQLPSSAGFRSVTTTKGTCILRLHQVVCSIGNMTSGERVTITIVVRPTQRGTISNTVAVGSTSPGESNPANNSDTEATIVRPSGHG